MKTLKLHYALAALVCSATFAAQTLAAPKRIEVPAGDLVVALEELSRQAAVDLVFQPDQLRSFRTEGVSGTYSAEDAIRILLKGTSLQLRTDASSGAMVIAPPASSKPETIASNAGTGNGATRLAQANHPSPSEGEGQGEVGQQASGTDPQGTGAPNELPSPSKEGEELAEIVVTGTHIRGATSSASPAEIHDRSQIDQTGLGSIKEYLLRLPQNFGGGASENLMQGLVGRSAPNEAQGTAVNLRGLGPDSTLVLINGRRVSPSSTDGNFVDISMIPLAAVERMEIVSDGASAIYGSDAVGGVVNFILRDDVEGAETRLRYGQGPHEAPEEVQIGQTLGHHWSTGSALLSYEYFDRTALLARERSFTEPSHPNLMSLTLLPDQKRQGGFLNVDQTVTENFDLFATGSYHQRSTNYSAPNIFNDIDERSADTDAYSAVLGGKTRFADRFELELSSSYSANHTSYRDRFGLSDTEQTARQVDTSIWSVDAILNGALGRAPAGPILFAIGGQHREESFERESLASGFAQPSTRRREVSAGFIEWQIPLVGPPSERQAANRLDLTLAARSEHYSDFGSTTNPKAGLVWRPLGGVKFRGTYGRSFKAPYLFQLVQPLDVWVVPQADPVAGGTTNVFVLFGNTSLDPERAATWTLGMDLDPQGIPGLRFSTGYYSIRFRDRVATPSSAGIDVFSGALQNESLLGRFVTREPALSLIEELADSASRFEDLTGTPEEVDLTTIGAIADNRLHNFATTNTDGIDLSVSYTRAFALGELKAGVDGTYILDYESQVLPTVPVFQLFNAPYLPADLKLRAQTMLRRGSLSVAAFINYVDSYTDARPATIATSGSSVRVSSWATADFSLGYAFGRDSGPASSLSGSLSIINITDKRPPFVRGQLDFAFPGVNYDGANANALGRSIALQLSKRWMK